MNNKNDNIMSSRRNLEVERKHSNISIVIIRSTRCYTKTTTLVNYMLETYLQPTQNFHLSDIYTRMHITVTRL